MMYITLHSSYHYADEIKRVRFGFLDRDSNFSLIYEEDESDTSLYPGDLNQWMFNIRERDMRWDRHTH